MLRDGGRVLNVSSGLARFCLPGHAAYGSAKAAVGALSRYMACLFYTFAAAYEDASVPPGCPVPYVHP